MKRVLVVDDNDDNIRLIRFIVQKGGYGVIEARDGFEGVRLAVQEKPDLIIMDIQLPGIDGLEATRRIRASEVSGNIPIIALTSFAMPADKAKALAAGCNSYIPKPIEVNSFIAEIRKYLEDAPNQPITKG